MNQSSPDPFMAEIRQWVKPAFRGSDVQPWMPCQVERTGRIATTQITRNRQKITRSHFKQTITIVRHRTGIRATRILRNLSLFALENVNFKTVFKFSQSHRQQ